MPNEKIKRNSLLEYLIFNGPLHFLARSVDESQDENWIHQVDEGIYRCHKLRLFHLSSFFLPSRFFFLSSAASFNQRLEY